MALIIKPLSESPHHIPALAQALFAEWHDFAPWRDTALIRARYQAALAVPAQALPQVWLAEDETGALLGTASLKKYDLRHHTAERYWLGDVFVLPEARGRGVGGALVRTCLTAARSCGIDTLYLYTPNMQALYARYGWRETDRRWVNGETVSVMVLDLAE